MVDRVRGVAAALREVRERQKLWGGPVSVATRRLKRERDVVPHEYVVGVMPSWSQASSRPSYSKRLIGSRPRGTVNQTSERASKQATTSASVTPFACTDALWSGCAPTAVWYISRAFSMRTHSGCGVYSLRDDAVARARGQSVAHGTRRRGRAQPYRIASGSRPPTRSARPTRGAASRGCAAPAGCRGRRSAGAARLCPRGPRYRRRRAPRTPAPGIFSPCACELSAQRAAGACVRREGPLTRSGSSPPWPGRSCG